MTVIAILGQGNMGNALAARLEGRLQVRRGAREPKDNQLSYSEAISGADVVLLAVPYDAALELAGSLDLKDKVVIDVSNPVKADYSGLSIGFETSAAEEIQKRASGASVVKAFNTIFSAVLTAPEASVSAVPTFLAGDNDNALNLATEIATAAGFKAEKVGGLDSARLLEPLGMLNIKMGYMLGKGTSIAPSWVDIK